ncbi:hypothetical protein [Phycicoccus sp.]|uniref:hypothetical protein n=1 Tax=Phycicoccus sp. TaxID=1902410 RepID=UPI002C9862A4|nr:hypothetical protein [Phycicoccus sp.]HMM95289.1 hypothetical protein [Phycicoccus sp.]
MSIASSTRSRARRVVGSVLATLALVIGGALVAAQPAAAACIPNSRPLSCAGLVNYNTSNGVIYYIDSANGRHTLYPGQTDTVPDIWRFQIQSGCYGIQMGTTTHLPGGVWMNPGTYRWNIRVYC